MDGDPGYHQWLAAKGKYKRDVLAVWHQACFGLEDDSSSSSGDELGEDDDEEDPREYRSDATPPLRHPFAELTSNLADEAVWPDGHCDDVYAEEVAAFPRGISV